MIARIKPTRPVQRVYKRIKNWKRPARISCKPEKNSERPKPPLRERKKQEQKDEAGIKDKAETREKNKGKKSKSTEKVCQLIKADPKEPIVELPKRIMTLKETKDFVGGYVNMINLSRTKILLVNEQGNNEDLLPNERDSKLCGQEIVGDVVLCSSEFFN